MAIKVDFLAHFRLITGVHQLEVDLNDLTIMELILELGKSYGEDFLNELIEDGKLMDDVLFVKNGELINNANLKLKEGDEIIFIPPAFGG